MKDYDLIIIGSGPAGLSSAQYSARSNLSTLVIDSPLPSSQLMNIWELENYPGVYPAVNGFDFLTTMQNQAKDFGAEFQNHQIEKIEKDEISQKFVISCQDENFLAKAIVVATGAKHRTLEITGEEEFTGKGVSYCATCDGPFFRNKTVVDIGGGTADIAVLSLGDVVLSSSIKMAGDKFDDSIIKFIKKKYNITSIYVTHDLLEATAIADYIYLLDEGEIVASGTPYDILFSKNPKVREFFDSLKNETF